MKNLSYSKYINLLIQRKIVRLPIKVTREIESLSLYFPQMEKEGSVHYF